MVASQVNHINVIFLRQLQDPADHRSVWLLPVVLTLQGPAVDNVPVEDQLLASGVLQKSVHLLSLGFWRPQVDVRQDDGAVAEHGFFHNSGNEVKVRAQCGPEPGL